MPVIGSSSGATFWRIYGYYAEEVVGKPITILVPREKPDEIPGILEKIQGGESVEHYETERVTKDGRRLYVSLSVSPILDHEGDIVGASTIARDITGRKSSWRAGEGRSASKSGTKGAGSIRRRRLERKARASGWAFRACARGSRCSGAS